MKRVQGLNEHINGRASGVLHASFAFSMVGAINEENTMTKVIYQNHKNMLVRDSLLRLTLISV
jgi:hypothetical protein